jgi:hypothetical protein
VNPQIDTEGDDAEGEEATEQVQPEGGQQKRQDQSRGHDQDPGPPAPQDTLERTG